MHPLIEDKPDYKMLLLGNEAIVRGAIEADIRVVSSYPGTPSSEIGNNFFMISRDKNINFYFEFSVNEKVAMEVAAAASASGLRSLVCMKHVGLNVASDVLMTLAYIGVVGGMVIINADDPSMHSSQNEQDNRIFARFANLPMLEPRSPQEAKEMTIKAFEISETVGLPVIIRTTTRTSHVRGPVTFGQINRKTASEKGVFKKDPKRWVPVPAVARLRHKALIEQINKAVKISEESDFNKINGKGEFGIISSGVASNYVIDAINSLNIKDRIMHLDLGFTFPIPRDKIISLLSSVKNVIIVEELEPFIEDAVKVIMVEEGISNVDIYGKSTGILPRIYEFTPRLVREAIKEAMGINDDKDNEQEPPSLSWIPELPMRPPVLCKGCPHRETYNAVKSALKETGRIDSAIYPTDIGCYTLGLLPPINMADYLICMGSSVGTSCGFSASTDHTIISFIGDSTFFHSGISPLVNAVHNRHKFILVILDNSTTAMTGHQPNPGITIKPEGFDNPTVSIEEVVRGCGVSPENIVKINPYKKNDAIKAIKEIILKDELSVIISESPCILFAKRVRPKS